MAERNITFQWASPKFKQLFLPYRYKLGWGGRGGGKSHDFCQALIRYAIRNKIRILCTREYQNSIKDSVHKLISDIISYYNMDDYFRITRESIWSRNGTEFLFKGLHTNINEIISLEGIDICYI